MRIQGWQRRLNVYLIEAQERYRAEGFGYGRFDCCTFAGDWAQVLTGVDYLGDLRGAYSTRDEAMELIGGDLYSQLCARLGDPVHPASAQRGDIAYMASSQACGIYFTSGARMAALFLTDGGFTLHRASDTDHAFRLI